MPTELDAFVPDPCDVEYDAMTDRGEASRTCGRCKTTVHDLGAMEPEAAERLVERARREKVCVKATVDGRGRIALRPPARLERRDVLRRSLVVLAPALMTACGGEPADQVVGKMAVGKVAVTETAESAPTGSATGAMSSAPAPRAWDLTKGAVQLHIVDKPGVLVDSTAPPPVPGQPLARHPFLSASCSGDALGCSQAGDIVRASVSTDDCIERLEKAGFIVKPAQP